MRNAALLFSILLLSSCAYRVEKEGEPVARLDALSVGFSEVQSAILGPKCARCHDWVASYDRVVVNLAELAARTQSPDPGFMMPPPGRGTLTAEEKAALQGWIERGAPQFAEGSAGNRPEEPVEPVPAPPGLNFANLQEKLFTPKCARCHSGMMGSYENVVANHNEIESRVRSPFEFDQMPPSRALQLTEDEKNLLFDWIKAGAPESNAEAPNSHAAI